MSGSRSRVCGSLDPSRRRMTRDHVELAMPVRRTLARSPGRGAAARRAQISLRPRKHLNRRTTIRIWRLPNSHVPVAACRSVGIRTRGRTAARSWRTDGGGWISPQITPPGSPQGSCSPNSDRQPEAKPANPESPRGTQLKATTERAFFGLAGPPKTSTEEACPSLPGVRGLPKRRLPESGRCVRLFMASPSRLG